MRVNGFWIYHYWSVGYKRQKVIRVAQRILSLANRKTQGHLLRRSLQKVYQPFKSMLSWNHRAVSHSALSIGISLKFNSDPSWVSSHVHQAGLPHHMESGGGEADLCHAEFQPHLWAHWAKAENRQEAGEVAASADQGHEVLIHREEAAERGWRWSSRREMTSHRPVHEE